MENKPNYVLEMKELINSEEHALLEKSKIYCTYESITSKIRSKLESTSMSFIEIGYLLKKVKESELYKVYECNNIYEYAKENFGLGETTTKNFINCFDKYGQVINEFSIDSCFIKIKDEYINYNYSQLVELLSVPEGDIEEFDYNLSVREIKQLKAKINLDLDIKNILADLKLFAEEILKDLSTKKIKNKIEDEIFEFKVINYKIGKSSSKYETYYCNIELKANVLFTCADFKINVPFVFYKYISDNTENKSNYIINIPSSNHYNTNCKKDDYLKTLKEYLFSCKEFKKHFALDYNVKEDNNFGKMIIYDEYLELLKKCTYCNRLNELQFIVDYIKNKFENNSKTDYQLKYQLDHQWDDDPKVYLTKKNYFQIKTYGIYFEQFIGLDSEGREITKQHELTFLELINCILSPEERENNYIYKILFGQMFDYEKELEIAEEENEKFNFDNLEELE